MKKKGFTLIELLAVIVILAIIAVITVPKIADMISSSREGGAEDSFYGTLKAAELGYTKALQSNTDLKGSTCNITDSKITCTNGVKIDVSGKTPESGTLVIDAAGSTIAKGLTLNGYKCYGDLSTSKPCVKSNVEVASETLIKKVTASGDGLYKDSYEDGRYVFKGQNPNNYITFNGEESGWQIIAVEADGTLKIIKKISIGKMEWDSIGTRDKSSNTYCTNGEIYGCNAWAATSSLINNPDKFILFFPNGAAESAQEIYSGSVMKDSSLNTYLNSTYYNSLIDTTNIVSGQFYVGSPGNGNDIENLSVNMKQIKNYVWKGKIGLINILEYINSTTSTACTKVNDVYNNIDDCNKNNWLKTNTQEWTITPNTSSRRTAVFDYNLPSGASHNDRVSFSNAVRPVLYLKSSIQLTGTGTNSDPYKISS